MSSFEKLKNKILKFEKSIKHLEQEKKDLEKELKNPMELGERFKKQIEISGYKETEKETAIMAQIGCALAIKKFQKEIIVREIKILEKQYEISALKKEIYKWYPNERF